MPFLPPNQQRQSTEGTKKDQLNVINLPNVGNGQYHNQQLFEKD